MADSEEVKPRAVPTPPPPMTEAQFESYVRIACWMVGWRLAGLISLACIYIAGDPMARSGVVILVGVVFLCMCFDDTIKIITRSKSMRSFS